MNFDKPQPTGQGKIHFLLNGRNVEIARFEYQNGNVAIRGKGNIENLSMGLKSPINGYAAAYLRPLKDVPLPGIKQLEKIISSIQKNAAGADIKGTLAHPKTEIVPLPKIKDLLRQLLQEEESNS